MKFILEKFAAVTLSTVLSLILLFGSVSWAAKETSKDVNSKEKTNNPAVGKDTDKDKLDWRAYDSFVNGVIAEQARDYYNASRFYSEALQKYPDSYEIRISLADVLFRMQKFDEALRILGPIQPEDINVYALRAICFRSVGDNDAARAAYHKVIEQDPLNQIAFTFLASEYRRLNQLDSLIWAYQHLVQVDDENPRLWRELGQFLIQSEEYDEAKQCFLKSLSFMQGRENLLAYVGLAETYRETNQPDSASSLYNEALQMDPNNSYLNRELATFYNDLDSVGLALQYAQKMTRLEPNNLSASRFLALMYLRADSIPEAETLLRALVNSGDNDPANYFYLGRIAIVRQDYESAKEYLTYLTQLQEPMVDGWLDLGFVYRSLNDTAKSLNVYNSGLRFVQNKEDSVKLMFAIGATYERGQKIKEATQTFERLLKLDPNHSQALNYLGYMLADRGEKLDYARNLIEKALELSPQNAAYLDSYGWVMYRLKKFDSAVTYLEKAVALQSDPIIYDHLGDAYKANGKTDDARIWWQKALELEPTNDSIREKLNE